MNKQTYRLLLLSKSGYGKTTLIYELIKYLIDTGQLNYKNLYIFAKDIDEDEQYKKMIKEANKSLKKNNFRKTNCSRSINIDFLEDFFNKQIETPEDKRETYWIIFDDQTNDKEVIRDQKLNGLFNRGRKYGINQIWSLHRFKVLDPVKREDFTNVYIGGLNDQDDIDQVMISFSGDADPKKRIAKEKMLQAYYEARKSRNNHGFLGINLGNNYGDFRLQRNLENYFYDTNEIVKDGESRNLLIIENQEGNQEQIGIGTRNQQSEDLRKQYQKDYRNDKFNDSRNSIQIQNNESPQKEQRRVFRRFNITKAFYKKIRRIS